MDFSAITSAVDYSTLATGVVAVGALIATVYVAAAGARMLLRFVRGS